MPIDYRLTTANQDDDKNRLDPASFVARLMAGKLDFGQAANAATNAIPGARGAADLAGNIGSGIGKFVENAPKENALLTALYGVSRPGASSMGAIGAALQGKNPWEAAGRGLTGEETVTGSDILRQRGAEEGPHLKLGPLDISARDAAGFAADVATDPLNLLTFGAGSLAVKSGASATRAAVIAGRGAEEAALAGRAAETAYKATRPLGSTVLQVPFTSIEKEIVPFDGLSALGRAANVATSLIPGGDAAKQALRRGLGQAFETHYDVKNFEPEIAAIVGKEGAPEVAAGFRRIGHAQRVYTEEARRVVEGAIKRMEPLSDAQRELLFNSQEAGVKISDTAALAAPIDVALRTTTNPENLKLLPDVEAARSLANGEVLWRVRDSIRTGTPFELTQPVTLKYNGLDYRYNLPELQDMARRAGATEVEPGKFAVPPATLPASLVRSTGDDVVDTVLRWYQDEYRPTYESIFRNLGLRTFLPNYFMRAFPEIDPNLKKLMGEIPGAPAAVGARPVQQRRIQFHQRTGAEGYSRDPRFAIAAEQLDLAQKATQKELNDFVQKTLLAWGRKLRPGMDAAEGYGEYFPKGRIATFLADTLTGPGRRTLDELLDMRRQGDVRPGESPATAAARHAPAPGEVPLNENPGANVTTAFSMTEHNRPYTFSVEALPIGDVIPSQLDSFDPTPGYPTELQPRNMAEAVNQQRIDAIVNRFNPEEVLYNSRRLDTGTPIIGKVDNFVEAGNARILALRRIQQEHPEKWAAYQAELRRFAPQFGIDPATIPPDAILVRRRISDVPNRGEFAREANQSPAYHATPFETAVRDAQRMPTDLPTRITITESQTLQQALESAANEDIRLAFTKSVPPTEHADILTGRAGSVDLSQRGYDRLRDALLAMTYPGDAGSTMAHAFVSSQDTGVQRVMHQVYGSLPEMSKAEALVRAGLREPGLTIAEDLAKAVNVLTRLKTQRTSLGDYLSQELLPEMGDRELTELQTTLLKFLYENSGNRQGASPVKIRAFLQEYGRRVDASAPTQQMGMFGEGAASRATKEEIVNSLVGDLSRAAEEAPAEGAVRTAAGTPPPAQPAAPRPQRPGPAAPTSPEAMLLGGAPPETVDQYLRQVRALRPPDRWMLPQPIADALNSVGNPRDNVGIFKLFDQLQGTWKASVTTIWPGFHTRNLMGGVFLNGQAGISDPRVYWDATRIQRAASQWFGEMGPELSDSGARIAIDQGGKIIDIGTPGAMPLDEFLRESRLRGALQSGYYGEDIGSSLGGRAPGESGVEQAIGFLTGGFVAKPASKLAAALGAGPRLEGKIAKTSAAFLGRVAGNTIEDNLRLTHILGRMRLGDTFDQAIESTRKYHIDYSDLTAAERKARSIIPFFSWSRHNIPTQLERLAAEPRQAALVSKVANAMQSDNALTPDEKVLMNNYVLERFGLVVGRDQDGNPKIVNGVGLPIEDIGTLFRRTPLRTVDQWLGMVGPMHRAVLEIVGNHSTFTGRPINDPTYQNLLRSVYPAIATLPGMKEWLSITEQQVTLKDGSEKTYYNADPWRMYVMTSVLGRLYYTAGKATDERKDWSDRLLNITTGMKITSADINRSAAATLRGEWGLAQTRVMDERATALDNQAQLVIKARGPLQSAATRQQYVKTRSDAMQEAAIKLDLLQSQAEGAQADNEPRKAAALRNLRDPVDIAMQHYHSISPDAPEFIDPETGVVNWSAFFDTRDDYIAGLPPDVQAGVKAKQLNYISQLPPAAKAVETEYQKAMAAYRQYQTIQPFATPVKQADLEAMRDLNRQYMAVGDAKERARWRATLPGQDKVLLAKYLSIRTAPSRQRVQFEKQHPEIRLWGFTS